MSTKISIATVALLLLAACTKFEDADITERKTFIRFYSSAVNYVGSVAELDTDGGFILSGEVRYDDGRTDALIIKTDPRGRKVWQKVVERGVVNAIRPTANGYVLAGDSIQQNPTSADINELVNTYAKLMLMDNQGNIVQRHITTDSTSTLTIDYHGEALAMDASGNIVMLGSFRVPGQRQASFVSSFTATNISDSLWYRSQVSLDNDLVNCRALHVTPSSNLVWATNQLKQQQNLIRQYPGIYRIAPNSAPEHYEVFKEDDERNHSVKDIRKSAVGYGLIGTYSETNGQNGNIYFLRTDASMNVIAESVTYIDGEELMLNNALLTEPTSSGSHDEGLALTAAGDGYVLAGLLTSTPTVGNGGKDILLVKVDAMGNLLWKKLLGGSGDETVTSIRETPDKGLLIFGTNTINGLSSLMLIKTDEFGEVKD